MVDDLHPPPSYRDGRGHPLEDPRTLWGLELRYLLCDLIASRGGAVCTVAELVSALERGGFELGGRPSKEISDALRWEVGRGRVVRVGRGRYRAGTVPGATRRRIRRVARHRTEQVGSWRLRQAAGSLDP
jgi:hypothetical protein